MPDARGREVTRRHDALAVRRPGARSTESVSFGAKPHTWAEVPRDALKAVRHDSPVVAERVGVDGSLYDDDGAVVEVLRAWRAHRDRLYVVVASRPMRIGGEAPQPAGPWSTVAVRAYDGAAPMRRRGGLVDADVPAAALAAGTSPAPTASPAAAGAAAVWPHLPATVRDGAVRAVAWPDDWLGSLVQYSDESRLPTRQEIVVLRRDAVRAVVVRAVRGPVTGGSREQRVRTLAVAPWLVEQFELDLAPLRQVTATREPAPWE